MGSIQLIIDLYLAAMNKCKKQNQILTVMKYEK